jgi:hypothetical protein
MWACSLPCRKEVTIREVSVFEGMKVELYKCLKFFIRWCNNDLQKIICQELECDKKTISKWCFNLRGIVQEILLETSCMLGGLDSNG